MSDDSIKYVLNGEERHYSRAELEAYYRGLLSKYFISEELFQATIDSLIRRLSKYDGDPYGHLKGNKAAWLQYHKEEASGFLQVHVSGGAVWPPR